MVLSANNTYTGQTTISAGTLQIGNGGPAGSLGTGAVVNNSTLVFSRSDNPVVANAISGTGIVRAISSVTLTGTNTYSGGTTIDSGGILSVGSGGTAGSIGSGAVANSGTLNFFRSDATSIANNISGTGAVTLSGTGVTSLSGTNDYSGTTTVNTNAGVLLFNTTGSLYNGNSANWLDTNLIVNSGGTLALTLGGANGFTAAQVQQINQLGTSTGGFRTGSFLGIDTSNGDQTYANVITNTNGGSNLVGLTKVGANTLTLTANNAGNYTGGTRILAGTLQVGDGGTVGTLGGGTVNISSGAALTFNRSNALSVNNTISGAGTFNQNGSGTTTLTGTQTYTGGTNVNAGTLLVNSNQGNATGAVTVANNARMGGTGTVGGAITVQNGGTLFGGSGTSTGTLTTGNVTIQSGGTLFANVAANGTNSTLALGANTLDLKTGSKLSLTGLAGFSATANGTYNLATLTSGSTLQLDAAGVADGFVFGEFVQGTGNVNSRPVTLDLASFGQSLNSGDRLVLTRSGNNLTLTFTPVPEPAFLLAACGLAVGGVVGVRKLRRKAAPADVTPAA